METVLVQFLDALGLSADARPFVLKVDAEALRAAFQAGWEQAQDEAADATAPEEAWGTWLRDLVAGSATSDTHEALPPRSTGTRPADEPEPAPVSSVQAPRDARLDTSDSLWSPKPPGSPGRRPGEALQTSERINGFSGI